MNVPSLVELSATSAVYDYRLFEKGLTSLPITILNTLLVTAVHHSRILTLRRLVSSWPIQKLVLKDCKQFDDQKAVLFAYCLQREKPSNLQVVDLRGCNIGYLGTTALCKFAVGMPVSENDVADMQVLDNRPQELHVFHRHDITEEYPMEIPAHQTPISVFVDCKVNKDNFGLVKQALVQHTLLDMKVVQLVLTELGMTKVSSLLTLVEPKVLSGLDLQMNSLESSGIITIAPIMTSFHNLTALNLAYNNLMHSNTKAFELLSTACKHMRLELLDMSGNRIGFEICRIIGALKHPLLHLSLNGCSIHGNELISLASMEVLYNLEHLELATNGLVHCIEPLALFLSKLTGSVRHLNLDENMFSSSSVIPFCSIIWSLQVLSHLSISYNHFMPQDRRVIAEKFPSLEIAKYKEWLF